MARTRKDRRNDFDEFYRTAKETFDAFHKNDPRAIEFQNLYSFYVCPGSRAGGKNIRVVEIFYGNRPFEIIEQGRNWKTLTEYGATLLIELDDNGYIIISLYPANTDNRKPIETSITLHNWLDPQKLKDNKFIRSLWNDFMAYMEYSSLDGHPTFLHRLRISYLRKFKHLVIDNKWQPTRFSNFISGVSKLVVSACISGAVLIYLITLIIKPKTTETETQLKEVNKNLETVSKQLDNISNSNNDIRTISITVDSIAITSKEILKQLTNQKQKKQGKSKQ